MKHYDIYIGIDPGVNTGICTYCPSSKKILNLQTTKIHKAMAEVLTLSEYRQVKVRLEDARLRTWYGNTGREVLQGVGSVKRDCSILEDFMKDNEIEYELVAPKRNKTKLNASQFKKITGYEGKT